MQSLLDYDAKVLLAWHESLKGDNRFTEFLLHNGFPELAALSRAILSDLDALKWLMDNGYPEFAILSDAIDDEDEAIEWLEKAHCDFLSKFAAACRKVLTDPGNHISEDRRHFAQVFDWRRIAAEVSRILEANGVV